MIEITDLAVSLAVTSLVVELTPGPNMAWLAVLAATEGRQRGFAAVAGVAVGLGIVGFAAAVGLATLVQSQPVAYQTLRWAGLMYLLYLSYEAWSGAESDGMTALGQTSWHYFRQGVVTNLLNPKAAVFYGTVLPGFLPNAATLVQSVAFSGIYLAVATLVHGVIVAGAGTAHGLLSDAKHIAIARKVMAIALMGVAIWLFLRT